MKGFLIGLVLAVIVDAMMRTGSARDVGVSIALAVGAAYIILILRKWGSEKKPVQGKAIAGSVAGLFLLACLAGLSEGLGNQTSGGSSTTIVAGTPLATDADQLIKNCGKPAKDDSTAYDSPRPPLVTRIIDYKVNGVRLRFIYVPGSGHAGDPPPYDWKLQMVANAKTNKLYDRGQMSKLMWCTASVPGPRLVAGQSKTDATN